MMFFCQLAHRDDIAHDMFNRNRSVVLGNVVDAAENDDRLRTEVDDILPESDEHFSRGLPAYTASDETVCQEEAWSHLIPVLGDAIAIENNRHF